MIKKYILIVFLSGLCQLTYGQTDSISSEIKNYPDSKFETIIKARRLISDYLESDNYYKIDLIKDYIIKNIEDEENTAFDIYEYWLLLYMTQDYNELLESISESGLKSENGKTDITRWAVNRYNDDLFKNLINKSVIQKEIILYSIKNSSITAEEKEFLYLHLQYQISNVDFNDISQDSLNLLSDKFISEYPYSVYNPFIRKIIRYKEKVSNFAFGYDFNGFFAQLNGNLKQSINNAGGIGFSFDILYKNFYIDFAIYLGGSKLKRDISKQNYIWNKDMSATIVIPQIMIGYILFNKGLINISPSIGLSALSISPLYDDTLNSPGLEEMNFNSNLAWSPGISLNFLSKPSSSIYTLRKSTTFQLYFQIRYSYSNYVFNQNASDFNGNAHQINLTFGVLMRKVYRIY